MTFHAANNYGTCLQAYALQKSVEKLGAECEIIRLRGEKLSVPPAAPRSLSARVTDLVVKTGAKVVKSASQPAFERFRREHYHYSDWVEMDQLDALNRRYDLFLSGSDQVWNYNIAGNLDVYLQTFVTDARKKSSYAASFGLSKLPADLEQRYAQALGSFFYLGIREPEGARLAEELTGRRAQVVVDPTQLLDREDWERVMQPVGSDKPYIMVYQLGFSKTLLQCAKKLSRDTGLRLVFVPFPEGTPLKGRYYPTISPAQWVYLMWHARYVVTNSFHGTAFSIGFQKDFYTEISLNLSALGSRITNLLDRYHLQDRRIGEGQLAFDCPIDYRLVEPLYQEDRQASLEFLRSALEGEAI
nr:polysaccharide pyruvyl transferase family protein [Anaerofilum hominis]